MRSVFVIRWSLWRQHWRLLLTVKLCRLLVVIGARAVAERWAPIIGGARVSRPGLRALLDSFEAQAR